MSQEERSSSVSKTLFILFLSDVTSLLLSCGFLYQNLRAFLDRFSWRVWQNVGIKKANGNGSSDIDFFNKIWWFCLWNDGKQALEMITKVFLITLHQQHLAGWLLQCAVIGKCLSGQNDNAADVHCRSTAFVSVFYNYKLEIIYT